MRRLLPAVFAPAAVAAYASKSSRAEPAPESPELHKLHKLSRFWVRQESQPGYVPPNASWPPPEKQHSRSAIPALQRKLARCGGLDDARCHGAAFSLAVALIGGSLFGHAEEEAETRSVAEAASGAELLRALAARDSPEGLCAWAYCLMDGELTEQDIPLAVTLHRRAAERGFAQSMHELGVIFYTGEWEDEGVASSPAEAVHWFRRAAEHGAAGSQEPCISGSMFLYAECLLEGRCVAADAPQALAWFAMAGERGHRGARARILDMLHRDGLPGSTQELRSYASTSSLRMSRWTAAAKAADAEGRG